MTKYQLPSACPGIQSSCDLIDIFVQYQISSPEFWVLGFGTQPWHPELGVWGLAWWNFTFIFLWVSGFRCLGIWSSGDTYFESQVLSSRFWDSAPGTWHLWFRVWHGEISHLYFYEFQASGVWASRGQVISKLNIQFQINAWNSQ
jgi:hypothetical protein